jgi:hypothetical protein
MLHGEQRMCPILCVVWNDHFRRSILENELARLMRVGRQDGYYFWNESTPSCLESGTGRR